MRIDIEETNPLLLKVTLINFNAYTSGAAKLEIHLDTSAYMIGLDRPMASNSSYKTHYEIQLHDTTWMATLAKIRFFAEDKLDEKIILDAAWHVDQDDDWILGAAIPTWIYGGNILRDKTEYKNDL